MFRVVCASIGVAAVLTASVAMPGFAQERHGGDRGREPSGDRFQAGHDRDHFGDRTGGGPHNGHGGNRHGGNWHQGNWRQGWHNNRWGWWWVAPGFADWYYYDAPVYPYPDPYQPPGVSSAGPGYWYYCPSPPGYFPYVAQCALPWQPVMPQSPPG